MFNVYECLLCRSPLVFEQWVSGTEKHGQYSCGRCHTNYAARYGVINTLIKPSRAVMDLIRAEQTRKPHLELPLFRTANEIPYKGFEEQQVNFEAIVSTVLKPIPGVHGSVLQLGCHETTYPLRWFRTRHYRTFGGSHILPVTDEMAAQIEDPANPQFALVDYENLPYANQAFDIVVISHLLGQLPDLTPVLKEIHRVLKPGGSLLLLNEPLKGWFDQGRGMPRYSAKMYARSLYQTGFRNAQLFFPEYQDQLLGLGRLNAMRYQGLAGLFRWIWKAPPLRRHFKRHWTLPGMVALGLPMNVLLTRSQARPASFMNLLSDLSWPPRLPWSIEPPPDALNNVTAQVSRRGDVGERRTDGRPGTRRSDDSR